MKETRHLNVERRRFTKSDLLALGAVFLAEAEAARVGKRRHEIELTLHCADGTDYSSEDMSHFADGAEADLKPPKSVGFRFIDYERGRWMDLSLTHGKGYTDGCTVRGSDRDWVQGVFTRVKERLAAAAPSRCWFTDHPTLTYHLLAVGFGSFLDLVISYWVRAAIARGIIVPPSTERTDGFTVLLSQVPALAIAITWAVRWFLGGIPALPVREWILRAWPDVELDLGPEHLKLEKMRRQRILAFVMAVLVPLLVAIVYDIARFAFWRAA